MAEIIAPERGSRAGGPGVSHWLGQKVLNTPLAMSLAAAQRLKAAIDARTFDAAIDLDIGASKFVGTKDQANRYRVTDDGIALLPVQGVLIDRGEFLGDLGGWMTSYEGLAEQFRRVAKDDAVKSVVLDIDSPGGMAAGLFDLTAELGKLKQKKKVYAIAANMAASAAYAIGCTAHEFYVTRLGIAGSIGVIALHVSYARALDEGGIDTTIIYAGDHKPDGNPYQQLSAGARAEMSGSIDQIYQDFVAHVAKARGLDEAAVRATQARVFTGDKAVSCGLADGVKSFEELLDHIRTGSSSARGKSSKGGRTVSQNSQPAARTDYDAVIAAALATIAAKSEPAAAAPAPAATPAAAPANAEAPASPAATDEKARIKAILDCDEAKDRPGLARHLALGTSLPAEEAKAILQASAPETKAEASPAAAFSAAMRQPGTSAGVRPDGAPAEASSSYQRPPLKDKFAAMHDRRRPTH